MEEINQLKELFTITNKLERNLKQTITKVNSNSNVLQVLDCLQRSYTNLTILKKALPKQRTMFKKSSNIICQLQSQIRKIRMKLNQENEKELKLQIKELYTSYEIEFSNIHNQIQQFGEKLKELQNMNTEILGFKYKFNDGILQKKSALLKMNLKLKQEVEFFCNELQQFAKLQDLLFHHSNQLAQIKQGFIKANHDYDSLLINKKIAQSSIKNEDGLKELIKKQQITKELIQKMQSNKKFINFLISLNDKNNQIFDLENDIKKFKFDFTEDLLVQNSLIQQQKKEVVQKIQSFKDEILKLDQQLSKLENQSQQLIQRIQKQKMQRFINSSDIIESSDDIRFLEKSMKMKKDSLKMKQIYKATVNGDKISEFDACCQGKGKCFVLVKSEKGKLFGGYRTIPFDRNQGWRSDMSSFMFQLDHKVKANSKQSAYGQVRDKIGKTNRLCYFNYSMIIYENCIKNSNIKCKGFYCDYGYENMTPQGMNKDTFLHGGNSENFKAIEVEVYQIV